MTSESEEEYAPSTERLMKMLETSPGSFLERQVSSENAEPSFHEYLFALLKNQDIQMPELISGCSISKTYAYQFINGERLPGRDIVLRIILFLRLPLDSAQRLLTLAGKNVLYPRVRRDAAILFCLQKKMTLDETSSFLDDLGEEPLL